MRLMSDVRSQQHRLLTQLQHAYDTHNESQTHLIQHELQEWDSIVSPQLLNTTITHIGSSLRTVGLEEVDQILDQLLTTRPTSISALSRHLWVKIKNLQSRAHIRMRKTHRILCEPQCSLQQHNPRWA